MKKSLKKQLLLLLCLVPFNWLGCSSLQSKPIAGDTVFHTIRLSPGDDVKKSIQNFAIQHQIKAASMVTAVGSLTIAAIRYANEPKATLTEEALEVVSLTGTVSIHGSHLHLAVSKKNGSTLGGHLMDGSIVRTTLELTLVEFKNLVFNREHDPKSGYPELTIQSTDLSKP